MSATTLKKDVIRAWRGYTGDMTSTITASSPLRSIVADKSDCCKTLKCAAEEIARRLGLGGELAVQVGTLVADTLAQPPASPVLTAKTFATAAAQHPLVAALYQTRNHRRAEAQIQGNLDLRVEYHHFSKKNANIVPKLPPATRTRPTPAPATAQAA